MTALQFRCPNVRLSESLEATRTAIDGHEITLRELLELVGEQGLLVFCAILAMPFLIPVTLPFASTALGLPMLFIGGAVVANRVPLLPNRLLDRTLPSAMIRKVLERAGRAAARFEHLVQPRLLGLTATPFANAINGLVLLLVVIELMAPLPLIPFANTLPAIAIILLCLGMAERDGAVIVLGFIASAVSTAYIGALAWLVLKAGGDPEAAVDAVKSMLASLTGGG